MPQVSQVRDGSGLDRTVAWSHLEDIYKDKMIYWMWGEEEEGVQVPGSAWGEHSPKALQLH